MGSVPDGDDLSLYDENLDDARVQQQLDDNAEYDRLLSEVSSQAGLDQRKPLLCIHWVLHLDDFLFDKLLVDCLEIVDFLFDKLYGCLLIVIYKHASFTFYKTLAVVGRQLLLELQHSCLTCALHDALFFPITYVN